MNRYTHVVINMQFSDPLGRNLPAFASIITDQCTGEPLMSASSALPQEALELANVVMNALRCVQNGWSIEKYLHHEASHDDLLLCKQVSAGKFSIVKIAKKRLRHVNDVAGALKQTKPFTCTPFLFGLITLAGLNSLDSEAAASL